VIGWSVARSVAGAVAGDAGAGLPLPGDLAELGRRAEEAVVAYTRLEPAAPLPTPEAVGRASWAHANLALLREMLAPVTGKLDASTAKLPGPARALAGGAVGAEIGAVVGYLGRRVLGQYEVALVAGEPPPPRLLLVAPNLREAAEKLDAPLEPLLAWVMVHEVTHAVQFGSVPWLRPHLGGLVSELLAMAELQAESTADGGGLLPDLGNLRALVERAKEGGLVAVAGPEHAALLDRVQGTMALIEGHAEHVMDAAGAGLVDDLPKLRAGLERRRAERSPLTALLQKLLGLDLKLRQYQEGKAFCDQVVAIAGIDGLNRAFARAENLPATAELADPLGWLARTEMRALRA
jgi:coenzyme F420 biosynthesis associated uncharacterized protein